LNILLSILVYIFLLQPGYIAILCCLINADHKYLQYLARVLVSSEAKMIYHKGKLLISNLCILVLRIQQDVRKEKDLVVRCLEKTPKMTTTSVSSQNTIDVEYNPRGRTRRVAHLLDEKLDIKKDKELTQRITKQ
jgi:hypothetical protein